MLVIHCYVPIYCLSFSVFLLLLVTVGLTSRPFFSSLLKKKERETSKESKSQLVRAEQLAKVASDTVVIELLLFVCFFCFFPTVLWSWCAVKSGHTLAC